MARKFGKLAPKIDTRTLQLSRYLATTLTPPLSSDWASKVGRWPMMGNDRVGDCTVAGAGHMIEPWTTYESGKTSILSDSAILKAYQAISGWNGKIGDPSDTGCYLLDVLNYWRKTGIGGKKITAYAQINPKNLTHVKLGSWIFGGLYLGFNLPAYTNGVPIERATSWTGTPVKRDPRTRPGSAGGHCVNGVYYDGSMLKVITWATVMKVSWGFFSAYCDEMYAVLSPDWNTDGKSPSGFDSASLLADLKLVAN